VVSWSTGEEIVVRIVTEDGAADAHDTLTHLLRRMLQIVAPSFATNRLKTLRQSDPEEQQAAQPHRWHSRNDTDRRLVKKLARTIAAELLASRFVVLHADGDARWSDRPSQHETSFRENLLPVVRDALAPQRAAPRRPDQLRQAERMRPGKEMESHVQRLVLFMPYWTIESWLYQNTIEAIRLCQEKYRGRDVEAFRRWGAERTRLDEEDAKDLKATCLDKKHNLELARAAYPTADVYMARTSFHAAVEALRACDPLRMAVGEAAPS
jgi:hypothetical protein